MHSCSICADSHVKGIKANTRPLQSSVVCRGKLGGAESLLGAVFRDRAPTVPRNILLDARGDRSDFLVLSGPNILVAKSRRTSSAGALTVLLLLQLC